MTSFTLDELARILGAEPSERPGPVITGVRPIEHAGSGDITYVANQMFLEKLAASSAGAVILPQGLDPGGRSCIKSRNPEADFARLTAVYYPYPAESPCVSERADVHPEAVLGQDVSIGPFSVIGKGTVIGDRSVIGAHVVIGGQVIVGEGTRIFPNVTIYPRVTIGRRVIIHSGSIIGADGFGFCRDTDESGLPVNVKKFHSGTVEIGDDVEIGALVAVDRALSGVTRIGKGVKLDNLVQIAHNVEIGDHTVIASQVGIAGSSSVGRYGLIGGQAGIRDHVAVGDGVILATRVGIYRNVPDGSIMAGSVPAMTRQVFLRAQSLFKRLPEMLDRIRKLERAILSNRKDTK
ncbi:MAG: UDP-3-O-(3-hydroxymyristoyl)glucosamine N-acyltransferase [Desulfomonile tiedjei]|uniref:UDP-3-O-acylglucosamine N-acyltransferase n=1 Tax=Desulfomonile tiedjei TaxID=2358 RepID=A0A9D6V532_9BACT|nr:UDP-3-O-(3-hydroxymyristoyl)glucosamine N-acyltransferase [Desulfomonile tiedjei]